MKSPYLPIAPEAAPTLQSPELVTSHPLTPQSLSNSSGAGRSPDSIASSVVFLSLFGLAVIVFAIYWVRRRRTIPKVSDELLTEEADAHDVEALAASRSFIVPVTPGPDVRWQPQIRCISGPALDEGSDRKLAALLTKRARSPPPSIKTWNQFPDPYAKSTPAHALLFSQIETPRPPKSSRWDMSPLVIPHALAVSGMETRSLEDLGRDRRASGT